MFFKVAGGLPLILKSLVIMAIRAREFLPARCLIIFVPLRFILSLAYPMLASHRVVLATRERNLRIYEFTRKNQHRNNETEERRRRGERAIQKVSS